MKSLAKVIMTTLLAVLIAGCSSPNSGPPPDPALSLPPEQAGGFVGSGLPDRENQAGTALGRHGGYGRDLDRIDGGAADRGGKSDWSAHPSERRVYFALNSSMLDQDALDLLRRNARWLASQSGQIIIEGHCDERGTREYNLALGQQRADTVVRFLATQGVNPNRLQAISYGKERPLVRGHDSVSWARNRRSEIVVNGY